MSEELLTEAYKRGLLTPEQKAIYDEAIKRGLVSSSKPKTMTAGDVVNRAGRNIGLHTRAAMEGAPGLVDMATSIARIPVNKAIHAMTGKPNYFPPLSASMSTLANKAGLPKPSNPSERITTGMTGLVSSGAGFPKLAGLSPKLAGLGENVIAQYQSMLGAGLLGESAKEAGLPWWAQLGASLTGGLFAPYAANRSVQTGQKILSKIPRLTPYSDDAIRAMFGQKGVDIDGLTVAAKKSLFEDVRKAQVSGADLDLEALRRLAHFHRVGAQATKGMVTQNPVQITAEQNAAKIAANQADSQLHGLPKLYNENNKTFIENLNRLGAGQADDAYVTGKTVQSVVKGVDDEFKTAQDILYKQARGATGRESLLDHVYFTQTANKSLDKAIRGKFLPDEIRTTMNDVAQGKLPLTVDVMDNLKTMLATASRSTKDGNVKAAIKIVRDTLENTPLIGQADDAARGAFDAARATSAQRFAYQGSAPAIKKILDGTANPDTFMDRFILSKTAGADDVKTLMETVRQSPQAMKSARNYISQWLKTKAIGESADDVGKFSQAGFNRALNSIGMQKLRLFFDDGEISQLQSLGKASSYAQVQPIGSAVNNSNSGALVAGKFLDWLGNKARAVPFGGVAVADPAAALSGKLQGWGYGNMPQAISKPPLHSPIGPELLPPFIYGSTLTPQQ